jgi:hypothetical protein
MQEGLFLLHWMLDYSLCGKKNKKNKKKKHRDSVVIKIITVTHQPTQETPVRQRTYAR